MTAPARHLHQGSRPPLKGPSAAVRRRRALVGVGTTVILLIAGVVTVRSARGEPTPVASSAPSPVASSGASRAPSTAAAPPPPTKAAASPAPSPVRSAAPTTGPVGPNPPPAGRDDVFSATGRVLIPVAVQSQLPLLPNGCEVTSLSMLLTAAGTPVDQAVLAKEQPTDATQPTFSGARDNLTGIATWGDPEDNFVGNVAGTYGYAIFHRPLAKLLDSKLPGRAKDLTGSSFSDVVRQVDSGTPVLLWSTTTSRPTDQWVTWNGPHGPVRATFQEHAVLLVGHTANKLIINNPLSGVQETVDPEPFIAAWRQLGRQALTVTPA